jgi:monoamine oxidase
MMTDDARPVVLTEAWKSPDAERLDRLSTADWISGLKMSQLAKDLLSNGLASNNGAATAKQSYLGNLAQVKGGGLEKYWSDSEAFRVRGGNQQVALRFARELGDQRLTLNCPVKEIKTNDEGVVVTDSEGRQHEADDVVLAIPPSTWLTIKFAPALPEMLKPHMGTSAKYIAATKDHFWREAKIPAQGTSDADINQIWEGTTGQGDHGAGGLIAFTSGPSAEVCHHRPVAEQAPAYLKAFEALMPGFNANFLKGRFIDWLGEPWTRAGYSFPAPGQVTTIGPILRQGIGHLHFAGEHTCYDFVGYMEGALTSGASLAKRLATRDGLVPANTK